MRRLCYWIERTPDGSLARYEQEAGGDGYWFETTSAFQAVELVEQAGRGEEPTLPISEFRPHPGGAVVATGWVHDE